MLLRIGYKNNDKNMKTEKIFGDNEECKAEVPKEFGTILVASRKRNLKLFARFS